MEQEWLTTLAAVDPAAVCYTDFVQEGQRLAAQLRVRCNANESAEAVVTLTYTPFSNAAIIPAHRGQGAELNRVAYACHIATVIHRASLSFSATVHCRLRVQRW